MSVIADLRRRTFPAALGSFAGAEPIGQYVFRLGPGVYIMTTRTMPDQVWGVGWAESDYWARRIWEVPFGGDAQAIPQPEYSMPSPDSLRIQGPLTFAAIVAREGDQVGHVSAGYRMTDGAFLSVEVRGDDDTGYYFKSTKPTRLETPVAIEFRLR